MDFRDALDRLRTEVLRLGAMATETIGRGTDALLSKDLHAAQQLIDADDEIDGLTLQIEEDCYRILALQNPVASDLRFIVSSIRMAIGDRNAEFAREWLEREGIPLVASDFGGPWSRKVILDPMSGDAFCRRTTINQPEVIALVKAENDYEKALVVPKTAPANEKKIELF